MAPQGKFVFHVKPYSRQLKVLLPVQERMIKPEQPRQWLVNRKNEDRIEKPAEINESLASWLSRYREQEQNPPVVSEPILILTNTLDRKFADFLERVQNGFQNSRDPVPTFIVCYESRNSENVEPFVPEPKIVKKNSKKSKRSTKVEVPMFKMNVEDFPAL